MTDVALSPLDPSKILAGVSLAVVIPAYNESLRIADSIRVVSRFLEAQKADYEIIVVDDGSTDGTFAAAQSATEPSFERLRVFRYDENQGKGFALSMGARASERLLTAFLDADLDLSPELLTRLSAMMSAANAEVAIGSKRHPESTLRYPLTRRLYSRIYGLLVRALFRLDLSDTQTGIKLFRTSALKQALVQTSSRRYAFDVDLLAAARSLGFRIVEAPVHIDFVRKRSRLGIASALRMFVDTFVVFFRRRQLERKRNL